MNTTTHFQTHHDVRRWLEMNGRQVAAAAFRMDEHAVAFLTAWRAYQMNPGDEARCTALVEAGNVYFEGKQ